MLDRLDRFPIGDDRREEIPVLISTRERAMAGWLDMRNFDPETRTAWHVRDLRNARRWDTTQGTAELAVTGPGSRAALDVAADALVVAGVTFIRPLSPAALESWYR